MKSIKKAIAAGIVAFGTGLTVAASDGTFEPIEAVLIAGGTLVAFGTTWKVSNEAPGA